MFKKLATVAVVALIAGTAFANENLTTAQEALRTAGVEITIPETATTEQIDQILAITSNGGLTAAEVEAQVKTVLGMN